MTTTTDRTVTAEKELVHRFIANVWNGEDIDAIADLAPSDLVVHQLGGDITRTNREEFRTFVEEFRHAVPDLTHHPKTMVAEGETVIVYQTVTGTPERQYEAMRPTGKSFDVPAFQMFRIEDGQIVEVWILPNVIGTLKQLDLLPDSPVKVIRFVGGQLLRKLRG